MRAAKSLFFALSCACAAVVVSSPARAEPPRSTILRPLSLETDDDDGPNGLFVGGVIMETAFYFNALVFGIGTSVNDANAAFGLIPIVGPFVAAGLLEPQSGWLEGSNVLQIGFIANGVGQTAATTLIILGLAGVGDDRDTQGSAVRFAPAAPGADLGMGVSGSF